MCVFIPNNLPMPRIAGIKLHKTPSGKIKSATIDMKKYGDLLQPLLQKLGALEEAFEDDFEKKWACGIPIEEVFDGLLKKIEAHPWKK